MKKDHCLQLSEAAGAGGSDVHWFADGATLDDLRLMRANVNGDIRSKRQVASELPALLDDRRRCDVAAPRRRNHPR
jgi:hypothetical protein